MKLYPHETIDKPFSDILVAKKRDYRSHNFIMSSAFSRRLFKKTKRCCQHNIIHIELLRKNNIVPSTPDTTVTKLNIDVHIQYIRIYFGRTINTMHQRENYRTDITIDNKKTLEAFLIDIAIPWCSWNMKESRTEKLRKSSELSVRLQQWKLEKATIDNC